MQSRALQGLDSLLSIAQMPGGVPVGTLAIGKSGAKNAALLAAAILGAKHPAYREAYRAFRDAQEDEQELRGRHFSDCLKNGMVLESLDLSSNNIGSKGAEVIADALKSQTSTYWGSLQKLDISSNTIF